MAQSITTPGAKDQAKSASAGAEVALKKVRSVKSGGKPTGLDLLPAEALSILKDAALNCQKAGVEVEYIDNFTRNGHVCVAFVLVGVERVEGSLRPVESS